MNFWKIKTFYFIFIVILPNLNKIQPKVHDNFQNYGIRFKSVKCQSDNKTILIKSCYLKPVSRKVVTFNFGIKLLVSYKKPFFGHSILSYRYGTIYRQIIDMKKLEVCAILDGVDTHPMVKLIIDFMKSIAPKSVHKCPYEGDWDLRNFTINMDLFDRTSMLFPEGTYRIDTSVFFNGSTTLNFSGEAEIKSPLKGSFG